MKAGITRLSLAVYLCCVLAVSDIQSTAAEHSVENPKSFEFSNLETFRDDDNFLRKKRSTEDDEDEPLEEFDEKKALSEDDTEDDDEETSRSLTPRKLDGLLDTLDRPPPKPSVRLNSTSSTKYIGDQFTVTCTGATLNNTWRYPNNSIIPENSNYPVYVKNIRARQKYELHFKSITSDEQGTYTCTNTVGNKNASIRYVVTVKQRIVKPVAKLSPSAEKVEIDEGEAYSVACEGNSLNVTWRNSSMASILSYSSSPSFIYTSLSTVNHTTLNFQNASASLSGTYVCLVNSFGEEATKKLQITVKPAKLKFSPDVNGVATVKENKDYDITCEGAVRSIAWYRNGQLISENKKENIYTKKAESSKSDRYMSKKLKIEDAQKRNDYEGMYVCVGELIFNGSRIERSFQLKVNEDNTLSAPRLEVGSYGYATSVSLLVGEPLEVECKGDTEFIEWLREPDKLKVTETSDSKLRIRAERTKTKKVVLTIKNVVLQDEGSFTCQVTKRNITTSTTFKLSVVEPAYFVNVNTYTVTANESHSSRLTCAYGGHPVPMLNFYHPDGSLILPSNKYLITNDTLIVRNTTYLDAGKYICKAVQNVKKGKTLECVVELSVLHKPVFPKGNNVTVEKVLGREMANLTCDVLANPAAIFSWFRNHTVVFNINGTVQFNVPENYVELPFTSEIHFGEYKCVANNTYGSAEQIINVVPMVKPEKPEVVLKKTDSDSTSFYIRESRNGSVESFVIQYKKSENPTWWQKTDGIRNSWDSLYSIKGLDKSTSYVLRVQAVNEIGESEYSDEVKFTTSIASHLSSCFAVLLCILLIRSFY